MNYLKTLLVPLKSEKRNFTEEFDQHMTFFNSVLVALESSPSSVDVAHLLDQFTLKCNKLTSNDYFRLMYINNLNVRNFILKTFQIVIKLQHDVTLKLETFGLINILLEWDVNIEAVTYRSEFATEVYRAFFVELIPDLMTLVDARKKNKDAFNVNKSSTSSSSSSRTLLLTSAQQIDANPPKANLKLQNNFIKLVSYVFMCVPFYTLIKMEFFTHMVDFLFDHLTINEKIFSELMLALSVNICNYDKSYLERVNTKAAELVNEELRLAIYEKCSFKAVGLMEINVREPTSRNLLKKSLNIYCQFINNHISDMQTMGNWCDTYENEQDYENSPENKWRQCLYKIVIAIVRILRFDFENQENVVEIELVIYFYELLKENLENLTKDDAFAIAVKLMDIIVKINDWSEKNQAQFKPDQTENLKNLSFELSNRFLHILGSVFADNHWSTFEKFWTSAIENWEPLAFKTISIYCEYNNDPKYFGYAQFLAQKIVNSWKINVNLNEQCQCNFKVIRSPHKFLDGEMLDAVANLALLYDHYASTFDEKVCNHYLNDLKPLLDIILNLFKASKSLESPQLLVKFYAKLFSSLKHKRLVNIEMWRTHIELIIIKLNLITDNCMSYNFTNEFYECCIFLIKSMYTLFGSKEMNRYKFIIEEVLIFIHTNCNVIQANFDDIFSVLKLSE